MDNSSLTLQCRFAILKIASRCNLNCKYCYMYNKGDSTYMLQPKVMSDEVVDNFILRTKHHCILKGIKKFTFILHGGEPLLAGKAFFKKFVNKVNKSFANQDIQLKFTVQTNGILLDKEWCELFNELNITIGISIDGPKRYNDEFRVYHSGKGSYDDIIDGINIAKKYSKFSLGVLSVINLNIPPKEIYNFFKELKISSVNYLMPDGNYEDIPSGIDLTSNEALYADWLIEIFDLWFEDDDSPYISFFDGLVSTVLGIDVSADDIGTRTTDALVIETNGDIEALDVLKICGDGFTKGDANIKTTSFEEALNTPLAKSYQLSHKILPKKCESCLIKEICGGGSLPHRYSFNNQFNNPSIYCNNLFKLIAHIQRRVIGKLPKHLVEQFGVKELQF